MGSNTSSQTGPLTASSSNPPDEKRGAVYNLTETEMMDKIAELKRKKAQLLKGLLADDGSTISGGTTATEPPPAASPTLVHSSTTTPESSKDALSDWREERANADAEFYLWVKKKMEEIKADENAMMANNPEGYCEGPYETDEKPLPDILAGESFFPPVEEVFPPEIWGTANKFPPQQVCSEG
ncbi:hypothetical protein ABW20_dc0102815 [Dactylellina cionopaga]|nr:hypothetical protein ABW20_dc0102815 [Dactylellina cionopaga]